MSEKFDKDLQKLEEQFKNYEDKYQGSNKKSKLNNNASKGLSVAIELVAALITGLLLGIYLDKLFNSSPFCLILSLFLSIIAAMRSIYKLADTKNDT